MQDEPWHKKRLRELEAAAPKHKRKKWQQRFVAVPMIWAEQLETCDSAATFKLALLLLYEHWHSNGARIRLTNPLAAKWGILPDAKSWGLDYLERRGLVSIERCSRKTPLVAVLHANQTAAPMRQ
jgi:hypothetical protein